MVRMARLGLALAHTLSPKVLTNFRLSLEEVTNEYLRISTKSKPTGEGREVVQEQPGGS